MNNLIAKLPVDTDSYILVYQDNGRCNLFYGSGYNRTYLGSESKKRIYTQISNNLNCPEEKITISNRECFELIFLENSSVSVYVTAESPDKILIVFNRIKKVLEHNLTKKYLSGWLRILSINGLTAIFRTLSLFCSNIINEKRRCKTEYKKFTELLDTVLVKRKSETIGLKLDTEGWAYVGELIISMKECGQWMDMQMLERAVANGGRFVFNEDRSKIRAIQK